MILTKGARDVKNVLHGLPLNVTHVAVGLHGAHVELGQGE